MDSLTKLAAVADRLTALPLDIREREAVLGPLGKADLEAVALILAARNTVLRERQGLIFPEDIRALRARLGLRQRDLAERIGVSANTIARWERGEMVPAAEMARRIFTL